VLTVIGLYRDMLKMKKEMAQTGADIRDSFKHLEEIDRNFNHQLDSFYNDTKNELKQLNNELLRINEELKRYLENRIEDSFQASRENFNESMRRMDEINRYVDKRLDQTTSTLREYVDKKADNIIDTLCTRMDIKFEEKESFKNFPKTAGEILNGELIKS
jgi:prophage DNA circulation protein